MKKRWIAVGLAGACAVFLAAGVVARPVGRISFTIENGGTVPLNSLTLARPDAPLWGSDRLGGAVAPGETTRVVIEPRLGGCLYDMKADFAHGGQARLFAVDVCRLNGARLTFRD